MSGPLNSSRPTTATLAGGVYNASTPAPNDGQAMALQVDNEGNLLVNIAVGGGGGTVTSKIEDSNGNPLLSNGAGALKVDGSLVTQPVSGTVAVSNFPTTQPVSGTVAVSNFPTTQPVSGSVSVSNFPATQPVSGTVAVSNFPATQPVSAVSLPLPSNAAQETGGNLATLAGTVTAAKVGVTVSNFPTTQAVSGTVTLGAGSAVIGHVINDAGTALIGKVGIDQTTPGTTNAVQDASDGPVTAGTAAGKSGLSALVAATSAPTPTAGQQIALQGDTSGNLRTSPFGATGSFHTASAIGTGSAVPSFTVPAATKWLVKSIAVVITLSTAATRQILMTVSNSGGSAIASNLTPITGAVNGDIYACTFAPGMAQSTSYVVLFTSGFATIPFPELAIGPGSTITLFVNGGVAGDAIQLNINYIQVPD